MKFEKGKFYRHTTGQEISIICEADTTAYGNGFVAETNDGEMLMPVGKGESHAENYTEITKEEWMKNFS